MTRGPHFPEDAIHRLANKHEAAARPVTARDAMQALRAPLFRHEDHLAASAVLEMAIEAHVALQDRYLLDTAELKSRIGQLLIALSERAA